MMKKKIFICISVFIFICILATAIILYLNSLAVSNNTIENNNVEDIIIPNVTEENTTFKLSDTKKNAKSVSITAKKMLENYNLYSFIYFEDTELTEIQDTDYTLLNDTILVIEENCTLYFKYELNGKYSDEVYEIKISNIKVANVTTEKVSEKDLKEAAVSKNEIPKQSTSPYFIKVNYGANVVTIYTKDDDGNYTVPFKAMVCSCGKYTPKSGTYKSSNKYAWRPLIHNVYGQYATRIVKQILFHSVPYSSNKKDTLLYEEYDKLGTKASEGCVRLTVKDAKWIYDNCPSGTMVEFYSDSNPGPLGKPTAQKISSVVECRNWDPTDPAKENPWHSYYEKEEENNENISNNITNDITNSTVDNIINDTVTNNTTIDTSTNLGNTIDNNIDNSINNTIDNNTINNTNNIVDTNTTIDNNEIIDNSNNIVDNDSSNNSIQDNNSVIENNIITESENIVNDITNETIDNNNNVTNDVSGNTNVINTVINNTISNLT